MQPKDSSFMVKPSTCTSPSGAVDRTDSDFDWEILTYVESASVQPQYKRHRAPSTAGLEHFAELVHAHTDVALYVELPSLSCDLDDGARFREKLVSNSLQRQMQVDDLR